MRSMLTQQACAWTHAGEGLAQPGGRVVLSNGQALPFSTCVVCTGSSYTSPIKPDVVSGHAQTTASWGRGGSGHIRASES